MTYIWMQGEADAGSGWGSVQGRSFLGVLEQFKRDLGLATWMTSAEVRGVKWRQTGK